MGDQMVGYRYSLVDQEAPLVSAILETHLKMPAGKEQAGTYWWATERERICVLNGNA